MKKHKATVDELPVGHPDNFETNSAMVARCKVTGKFGASADSTIHEHAILAPGKLGPAARAVYYLGLECTDAEHEP